MNSDTHTITCIIPAFNEGPRIREVLALAASHHLISETIVVNDGSTDDTQSVIEEFSKVRAFHHKKNRGKSAAIHTGLSNAEGNIICFLDADLSGLSYKDITELITPVLQGKAGMTISMRKNSPWIDRKIGLDYISGERVFHKELLNGHMEEILTLPHFGLEVFLNKLVIKTKTPLMIVHWKSVESPMPFRKHGVIKGTKNFVGMLSDIFEVVSVFEVAAQFVKMRRLRVKTQS